MKLGALIADLDCALSGDPGVEIAALCRDSRQVAAGDLFFSLARDPKEARVHAEQALGRGAHAVVMRWSGDDGGELPTANLIRTGHPRALMGAMAARFFAYPSRALDLVGITGTNGKTTSSYLLAAIFEAAGESAGVIGTLGASFADERIATGLTTPESIDIERVLARMRAAGVTRAAAEVSSIGLDQGRCDGLDFRAALFTNLGRDHLDYHPTIDDYFACKRRLFDELLAKSRRPDPVAVALLDDPYGRRILSSVSCRTVSFGLRSDADIHPAQASVGSCGIQALLALPGKQLKISSPLLGQFNLLNILGAVAVSVALGIDDEAVAEGVRRCPGAAGRMEVVARPRGAAVMVDYAHKPEALTAVLSALRALSPRRLICVFGCGGDRDRGKRPIMGEIAARMADLAIATSDNPRSENPHRIIAEVEAGMRAAGADYVIEPDRRTAIGIALREAGPNDMVVIAGKGHEDYQIVGGRKLHFDDREVVRELLAEQESQPG